MKDLLTLLAMGSLLLLFAACTNGEGRSDSASTEEFHYLSADEIRKLKIRAIDGDKEAACSVADFYISRREYRSDGIEWAIIAARLGCNRMYSFLKSNHDNGAFTELVDVVLGGQFDESGVGKNVESGR